MLGPSALDGCRLASGSVQSSALAGTAVAVPGPETPMPNGPEPPCESGSRVSDAVTAQATAIPVTPPQPRSLPRVELVLVIVPPLTGTPTACG